MTRVIGLKTFGNKVGAWQMNHATKRDFQQLGVPYPAPWWPMVAKRAAILNKG